MPLKPRQRYVTFSLRTFFVLLTVFAVWLGVVVNRAREQREAVVAIEALGGVVVYDWQPKLTTQSKGKWTAHRITEKQGRWEFAFATGKRKLEFPAWLRRIVGDELFQDVHGVAFIGVSTVRVHFTDERIRRCIPHLKRLQHLKTAIFEGEVSDEMMTELKAALPDCDVIQCDYYTFPKGQ